MNKKIEHKIYGLVMLILTSVFLTACGSSEPCDRCGTSPTKSYKNDYTGENEYYCSDCSSNCEFCGQTAIKHYTSGLGLVIFACDDCYQEIMELNQ